MRSRTDKADLFDAVILAVNHMQPPVGFSFMEEYTPQDQPVYIDKRGKERERKWRFDFANPVMKIAVEIDGNAWNVAGGGRHGYDSDRDKINWFTSRGWSIFHFSPKQCTHNPAGCADLIVELLNRRTK